jgi:hypothetical protein
LIPRIIAYGTPLATTPQYLESSRSDSQADGAGWRGFDRGMHPAKIMVHEVQGESAAPTI